MKISKEKAAENRQALVAAAARLFKAKGVDGVGVAEISKEAGLTHGALYAHFSSKDELAAEAMQFGNQQAWGKLTAEPLTLARLVDYYLSPQQRDNLAEGCPLAAAASEAGRQEPAVSAAYRDGFKLMAAHIASQLPAEPQARQRGMAVMAALIGAVAVSRSVHKADPALADEVLQSVHKLIEELS